LPATSRTCASTTCPPSPAGRVHDFVVAKLCHALHAPPWSRKRMSETPESASLPVRFRVTDRVPVYAAPPATASVAVGRSASIVWFDDTLLPVKVTPYEVVEPEARSVRVPLGPAPVVIVK